MRVVEEQDDRPARREPAEIGPRRVDARSGIVLPVLRPELPPPPRLAGRQDREPDAGLRQHLQRLDVDGRLGQPHPLGVAAEAMAEVGDAPEHLRLLVVPAGQRHDDVVVNLGQRVAVPAAALAAEAVGLDDPLEDVGGVLGHPGKEGRPEVEAHPGIVVQEMDDPPLRSRAAGTACWGRSIRG